jgi:hypothetical protein
LPEKAEGFTKRSSAAFPSWFDKLTITDYGACPEPVEGGALYLDGFEQPVYRNSF